MEETMFIVQTDESGAREIDRIVQDCGGSPGIVTQPKNLDGDVAAWIVATTATIQALPPLLNAIKDLLTRDKVKSLVVGEIKLENPTAENVEQILRSHFRRDR